MTDDKADRLLADYASALGNYLSDARESTRARAIELGYAAVGDGHGVRDMGAIHQRALEQALNANGHGVDLAQRSLRASEFFRESLSAFETSDRASKDAGAQLQTLTGELQAANAELRLEAQERQRAEAAMRASEEKFSAELQAANAELRREAQERQRAEAAVRATEDKFSSELQAANAKLRLEAQERQRAEAAVRATEDKFSAELQAANAGLRREAQERQQAEATARATEEKFSAEFQAANAELRREADQRQQAETAVRATEEKFSGELQAANAKLRREADQRQQAETAVRATEDKFSAELQAANAKLRLEAQERQRAEAAVRATEDKFSAELQAANSELRREAQVRQQAETAVRATEDKFSAELQAANAGLRREADQRQQAEAAVRATEEKFSAELQAANAKLRLEAQERQRAEAAVRATEDKFSSELQAANAKLRLEAQERQRAETSERQSAEKFAKAFRASPVGIVITRRSDGAILEVNDSYLRIVGYTRDQVQGRSTLELGLMAPDQSAAINQALDGQGFARDVETRLRTPAGAWIDLLASAELIELDGAPASLTIMLDITARKVAEEVVRKLNTDLEKQAVKLEALNHELEAFSYSVSHDLRAPLRHVGGYVVMLQKNAGQSLDEKNRRYLDIIAEAAARMGQLIDDLLSFSRVGRTELRNTRFPMQALVEEVIRELEPDTRDRKVSYDVGALPAVTADRPMLRLVWANLISNALKYSRTREAATIEIGCEATDTETVFHIHDNGVGFDMQYVDKLFGVFQRLHSAAQFEGTGIGLANVRRIIDRHGGRTWAEGVVDGGATLYFALPNQTGEPGNG